MRLRQGQYIIARHTPMYAPARGPLFHRCFSAPTRVPRTNQRTCVGKAVLIFLNQFTFLSRPPGNPTTTGARSVPRRRHCFTAPWSLDLSYLHYSRSKPSVRPMHCTYCTSMYGVLLVASAASLPLLGHVLADLWQKQNGCPGATAPCDSWFVAVENHMVATNDDHYTRRSGNRNAQTGSWPAGRSQAGTEYSEGRNQVKECNFISTPWSSLAAPSTSYQPGVPGSVGHERHWGAPQADAPLTRLPMRRVEACGLEFRVEHVGGTERRAY